MTLLHKYQTHICLVSSQPTPNLIPALDPAVRPREVVLVVSDGMRTAANHLQAVLERHKVVCEQWPINDPFDIDHVRMRLEKLLQKRSGQEIALNVTGGTKVMALAAQDLFQARGLPIFYVHPKKDELIWLSPRQESVPIADSIKLDDYLAAHGYRVAPIQRASYGEQVAPLTSQLLEQMAQFAAPLGTLNHFAGTAENRADLTSEPLQKSQQSWGELSRLIDLFASHGFVQRVSDRLRFPDETARFLVNGGWLERHLFETLLGLKEQVGIQDLCTSLRVESEGGSPNEIDVAFLWNNKLHLIECKTRTFRATGQQSGPGANTLYKMDTLRDLGGINTRSLLVSYQPLADYDKQRARDLQIRLLTGTGLKGLDKQLEDWITR